MLLVAAFALSRRPVVRVGIASLVVVRMCYSPLPLAHGLVRGVVTALGVLCGHSRLQLRYDLLRIFVAVALASFWGGSACTSKWMSFSPVGILVVGFSCRVNPPVVLALAAVVWHV
jgi:hypothetical protein